MRILTDEKSLFGRGWRRATQKERSNIGSRGKKNLRSTKIEPLVGILCTIIFALDYNTVFLIKEKKCYLKGTVVKH